MANRWIFFLYAFFLPLSVWGDLEYLFVLFDAGETHALRPVIHKCLEEGKDFKVLKLGTARDIDLQIESQYIISGLEQVDRRWNRHKAIEALPFDIKPCVVVIGVSSKIQHQVAQKFRHESKIIAYYDNFNPIDEMPFAQLIREIEKDVDLFLVPTREAALSSTAKQVAVVGQPDLQYFAQTLQALPYVPSEHKMVYIGGYDSEYEAAFRLFVQSCPQWEVVVCPHPKTDGLLERRILEEEGRMEMQISQSGSTEAIAKSTVVVCHRSTLGIKAAFAGKQVIFFDVPEAKFKNLATDRWGVAQRVTNQDEFLKAFSKKIDVQQRFQGAGIPLNATQRVYDCLVP